jgi:hypothetical protein
MTHCKTEFSDLILATTGRWWPIVRQSFPTLSLPLLVGGSPLLERVFLPYPCHYWSAMARCKTEFSDLILAATGPWWPVVRHSFPTLSLALVVRGGPLQDIIFRQTISYNGPSPTSSGKDKVGKLYLTTGHHGPVVARIRSENSVLQWAIANQ